MSAMARHDRDEEGDVEAAAVAVSAHRTARSPRSPSVGSASVVWIRSVRSCRRSSWNRPVSVDRGNPPRRVGELRSPRGRWGIRPMAPLADAVHDQGMDTHHVPSPPRSPWPAPSLPGTLHRPRPPSPPATVCGRVAGSDRSVTAAGCVDHRRRRQLGVDRPDRSLLGPGGLTARGLLLLPKPAGDGSPRPPRHSPPSQRASRPRSVWLPLRPSASRGRCARWSAAPQRSWRPRCSRTAGRSHRCERPRSSRSDWRRSDCRR